MGPYVMPVSIEVDYFANLATEELGSVAAASVAACARVIEERTLLE